MNEARRCVADRFEGQILGVGSAAGVRVVIGRWPTSPLGDFADCMVALPDGQRVLLAPSQEVADYVSDTYQFDQVRIVPVRVHDQDGRWIVDAGPLHLTAYLGARTALGRLLRLLPARLASRPSVTLVTDPIARVAMKGVRTRGTAGGGRREYYGAGDMHAIIGIEGEWEGVSLGTIAPMWPEPGFGFSSTPRTPSMVAVTTTIRRG